MKDMKIAEGLRFLSSGVILFAYAYVFCENTVRDFAKAAGPVGLPMVLLIGGSVIYFIYRPLLYDPLIKRLQTGHKRERPNYRQLLMDEYGISFKNSDRLFIQIRDTYLYERYTDLKTRAAGIHMTYLASLLAMPCILLSALAGDWTKLCVFTAICGLAFVAGFLNDGAYEEKETDMLLSLGQEKRDEIANRLGFSRRTPAGGVDPDAAADKS